MSRRNFTDPFFISFSLHARKKTSTLRKKSTNHVKNVPHTWQQKYHFVKKLPIVTIQKYPRIYSYLYYYYPFYHHLYYSKDCFRESTSSFLKFYSQIYGLSESFQRAYFAFLSKAILSVTGICLPLFVLDCTCYYLL